MRKIQTFIIVLLLSTTIFAQTPTLVYDIAPGTSGSHPNEKIEFNGKLYFGFGME